MALIAKKTEGDFELTPAGTFAARCVWVIDLGTQKTSFNGQDKYQHKALFGFELPDELMKDGRPFFVSGQYTLSLSEKANLRGMLEAWRGQQFTEEEAAGFDVMNVLGKSCMLSVIHNQKGDKTYANIASVAKPPKGMTVPPQVNPSVSFSLAEFDQKTFDNLPEWVRNKITQSREYQDMGKPIQESENPAAGVEDLNDDISF